MKKFTVDVTEVVTSRYIVRAESEEEAREVAIEAQVQGDEPLNSWVDEREAYVQPHEVEAP